MQEEVRALVRTIAIEIKIQDHLIAVEIKVTFWTFQKICVVYLYNKHYPY